MKVYVEYNNYDKDIETAFIQTGLNKNIGFHLQAIDGMLQLKPIHPEPTEEVDVITISSDENVPPIDENQEGGLDEPANTPSTPIPNDTVGVDKPILSMSLEEVKQFNLLLSQFLRQL